jgi:hypothetical protein
LSYAGLCRVLAVLWGVSVLVGFPAVSQGDELSELCHEDALPEDIRSSLERRFSGWKIQSPTDLTARARETWAAVRPLACPGIAAGHFDGTRASSYALLLRAADHASCRLLIFTQQQAEQPFYGYRLVDQVAGCAGDVFVRTVPTSQYLRDHSKLGYRSRLGESVLLINVQSAPEAFLYVWVADGYQRQIVSP